MNFGSQKLIEISKSLIKIIKTMFDLIVSERVKNLFFLYLRPSLFTCLGSLIDLLVDLFVKLKMVVSCSIMELEKNFKNQNSFKKIFQLGSIHYIFALGCTLLSQIRKKHLLRVLLRNLLTTNG